MRRREFITLLGGAATGVPFATLAQQQMPLVGFLNTASPDTYRFNADSFREGLAKKLSVNSTLPFRAAQQAVTGRWHGNTQAGGIVGSDR